jgi:invasion protein IalB
MPFDLNSNPVRIAIGAGMLVIGLIIGWFGHKAASAPPDVATASQYDDWRLTCPKASDKNLNCELATDVADEKGQTDLAHLTIFKAKEGPTLVVMVPYNVLLEPGIGLAFGNDKPKLYPYEVCNGAGCVVRIKFDDDLSKAMLQASSARILVAGLDGKAAALPFSLKGFVAAHGAYANDDAKRHSWWQRLWS